MRRESTWEMVHITLRFVQTEMRNQYGGSSVSQQIYIEWRTGYGVVA